MEDDFDAMVEEILWPSLMDENENENEDYDPTPYCGWCKSMTREGCDCGPISKDD